jgi:hypothetical protein
MMPTGAAPESVEGEVMDRDEVLGLLRGGRIEEWNRRREAGEEVPDLERANLEGANLSEANFRAANFRGAILVRTNLFSADLVGASLEGANFRGANLGGTNLREANLLGAILQGANLQGTLLMGANLSGAFLDNADLRGADLHKADFTLARLMRCKLNDAVFDGAVVDDCLVRETIGRPKPPSVLRAQHIPGALGDRRYLLTGEDATTFFNPVAIVEVYLTEVLTDEELGAFRFHLGDMRRQGAGIGVHLTGEREEAGSTILRFQAPNAALWDGSSRIE